MELRRRSGTIHASMTVASSRLGGHYRVQMSKDTCGLELGFGIRVWELGLRRSNSVMLDGFFMLFGCNLDDFCLLFGCFRVAIGYTVS